MDKKGSYISITEKIIMFLVALMSVIIMCGIVYNLREMTFVNEKNKPFLFLGGAGLSVGFFLFLKKWFGAIDRLSKRGQILLTAILFVIHFLVSMWLFANIDYRPNTDSLTDIDLGWFLRDNILDESNSHIRWIKTIPNNYFLILTFKQLAAIAGKIGIKSITAYLWLVNYFLLFIGTVLTFLCALELSEHATANKTLSLIVLNPIYYYLAFWVYSSSMSVPLLMGICYVLLRIYREENIRKKAAQCLILAVLIILGFQIRVTTVFPVIAYVVMRFFDLFDKDKKDTGKQVLILRVLFALCVLVVSFGGIKAINGHISDIFGPYQEYNLPITRLLFVGSHGDGSIKTEYEDNGFDYSRLYGKSKEEKSKIYIEGIKYNYKRLGPVGTCKLWANKLRVTFSDAFPSVVSRTFSGTYSGQIFEILKGDVGEFFAYVYRMILIVGIFLCACFCLKGWGETDRRTGLLLITMFGTTLFYLIWEVKGDYADSLLPLMAILCAFGIDRIPKVHGITDKRAVKVVGSAVFCVLCVALFVIMISNAKYTHNRINGDTYSRSDDNISLEVGEQVVLRQNFYCSDVFNRIVIRAESEEKSADYQISLYDQAGNTVYDTVINSGKIKKSKIKLDMDDIVPSGKNSEYLLEIKRLEGEGANITFYTGDNYYIDSYDGSLTMGDVSYVDDLSLKVEYCSEGPFVPLLYVAIISVLCLAMCLFGILKSEDK